MFNNYPLYSRQPYTQMFVVTGTKSGSTITLTNGSGLFTSAVSGGTGIIDFVFKNPSKKIVVADGSATGAAKRLFITNAATTGFRVVLTTSALNAVADGGFCVVGFVSDMDMTESYAPTLVSGLQPSMRIIFGNVLSDTGTPFISKNTGSGADLLNDSYSVTASSAAAFTVTYTEEFLRAGAVLMIPSNAAVTGINISQTTAGFTATMTDIANVPTAVASHYWFAAVGFDLEDDITETKYASPVSNLRNGIVSTFSYDQTAQASSINTPTHTITRPAAGQTQLGVSADSFIGIGDAEGTVGNAINTINGTLYAFASIPDGTNWLRLNTTSIIQNNAGAVNCAHQVIAFQPKGYN